MNIDILKTYVEDCLAKGINPTFDGLKLFKDLIKAQKKFI